MIYSPADSCIGPTLSIIGFIGDNNQSIFDDVICFPKVKGISETEFDIHKNNSLDEYELNILFVKSLNIIISLEFGYDFSLSIEMFTNLNICLHIPSILKLHIKIGEL